MADTDERRLAVTTMEWWWVLVGWLVASVGLAAAIARWFRWLRDG
jgi:hypothetical protein